MQSNMERKTSIEEGGSEEDAGSGGSGDVDGMTNWGTGLSELFEPWEYLITPDHFEIWKRHLAWSKTDGDELLKTVTQRFGSSMVFVSLLLSAQLSLLFNSAQITTLIREDLRGGQYGKIEFYIGLFLVAGCMIALFALLISFTAWGMVSSLSKQNALPVLRSSIGQQTTTLPSRMVALSFVVFLIWMILYMHVLLPPSFAVTFMVVSVGFYLYMVKLYSAFGRLLMHSGAMGDKPIFDMTELTSFQADQFHERLSLMAVRQASNIGNNSVIVRIQDAEGGVGVALEEKAVLMDRETAMAIARHEIGEKEIICPELTGTKHEEEWASAAPLSGVNVSEPHQGTTADHQGETLVEKESRNIEGKDGDNPPYPEDNVVTSPVQPPGVMRRRVTEPPTQPVSTFPLQHRRQHRSQESNVSIDDFLASGQQDAIDEWAMSQVKRGQGHRRQLSSNNTHRQPHRRLLSMPTHQRGSFRNVFSGIGGGGNPIAGNVNTTKDRGTGNETRNDVDAAVPLEEARRTVPTSSAQLCDVPMLVIGVADPSRQKERPPAIPRRGGLGGGALGDSMTVARKKWFLDDETGGGAKVLGKRQEQPSFHDHHKPQRARAWSLTSQDSARSSLCSVSEHAELLLENDTEPIKEVSWTTPSGSLEGDQFLDLLRAENGVVCGGAFSSSDDDDGEDGTTPRLDDVQSLTSANQQSKETSTATRGLSAWTGRSPSSDRGAGDAVSHLTPHPSAARWGRVGEHYSDGDGRRRVSFGDEQMEQHQPHGNPSLRKGSAGTKDEQQHLLASKHSGYR